MPKLSLRQLPNGCIKAGNPHITAKQKLEAALWDIANTLRGKMAADDFLDYIPGFIFYKYLSVKMHRYAMLC